MWISVALIIAFWFFTSAHESSTSALKSEHVNLLFRQSGIKLRKPRYFSHCCTCCYLEWVFIWWTWVSGIDTLVFCNSQQIEPILLFMLWWRTSVASTTRGSPWSSTTITWNWQSFLVFFVFLFTFHANKCLDDLPGNFLNEACQMGVFSRNV